MKVFRTTIQLSETEVPRLANLLTSLSRSQSRGLLELIGLEEHPDSCSGSAYDFIFSASNLHGLNVELQEMSDGDFEWCFAGSQLGSTDRVKRGPIPEEFRIFVKISRKISWWSEDVPLGDGGVCKFEGNSIRSLLLFMELKGSVDSSWLTYLARHPERLDEDIDALREEFCEEFCWD